MIWSGSDKLITEDNTQYKGVGIEMVSDADNYMKFSASADTSNVIDMSSYRFKFGSGSSAFISSSGDGKMYPFGLFIGTVTVKLDGSITVKPSSNLNDLNYVQVINWNPKNRGIDISVDPIFYE